MMGDVSPQSNDRQSPSKAIANPFQCQLNMSPFSNTFASSSSQASSSASDGCPKTPKDQPMFTAKQVILLCERLWKEREEKLKAEYDQVLHERLLGLYELYQIKTD